MSKTPNELAVDYCEPILSDDYAKAIGRENWIGTRCVKVGEGHEMYKASLAGYKAAQEQSDSCEHILDMSKMVDVNSCSCKGILNNWISVKDRLPEDATDVLIAWADGVSEGCYCDERWNREGRMLRSVTHWMPLPKPPKDAKE